MGIAGSILSIVLGILCIFQGYATYRHANIYNKEIEELRKTKDLPQHAYNLTKEIGMLKKDNTWIWVVLGILWLALGILGLC